MLPLLVINSNTFWSLQTETLYVLNLQYVVERMFKVPAV